MKRSFSLIIFFLAVLGSAALLAYAGIAGSGPGDSPESVPDADDVSALIEELENDPGVREMLNGYVYYPQQWQDWYDSLPDKDDKLFCKLHVLTWIKLKSDLSEAERPADHIDLISGPQDKNYGKPTPEPPDDIQEQIEKLENDPVIHELVDYYAEDPELWWKWYETLPDEHEELVSKIYALKWVQTFSGRLGEPIYNNFNLFIVADGLARAGETPKPYNEDEYVSSETRRINELENDPTIRETIETYAPDPQQWWDWYEALPEKSDSELSRLGVMEWVELFSLQSEEGRTGLYYDLLQLPAKLDD